MEQPLISIIIPVYNGASYIVQMVKMIKAQTYKNLEVLLIDDGSIDATVKLYKQYIERDMRFTLFHKENGGASAARNYGLRKAQGECIAFIDVDDYIFPHYIEYLYNLLVKYNADMSCCGYYKMWDTEKVPDFKVTPKEIVFTSDEAIEDLLYRKSVTGYPFLKLYKAAVIKNICFPEGIIYGEDMLFTLEAVDNCRKIIYGNQVLYIYYQHSSSATHRSNDAEQYKKSWDLHCRALLAYIDKKNPSVVHAVQAKLFILALGHCCRIWKVKGAQSFRKELLEYMKSVDGSVLRDNKCKSTNRILACLSCISTSMLVKMCRIYTWIKQSFKFETRKSV